MTTMSPNAIEWQRCVLYFLLFFVSCMFHAYSLLQVLDRATVTVDYNGNGKHHRRLPILQLSSAINPTPPESVLQVSSMRTMDKRANLEIRSRLATVPNNKHPLVFLHGSFHASWCYDEHFMPFFSSRGYDCHSYSLRGTSKSPLGDDALSINIDEHIEDFDGILSYISDKYPSSRKPIIISHSFGGILAMKALEHESIRYRIDGVVNMASIPPSGNGQMTKRFIKRDIGAAFKIVWAFVFKGLCTNVGLCEELLFGGSGNVAYSELIRYMENFKSDSKVGVNLSQLNKVLPSATSADERSRAKWLAAEPNFRRLVIGAELDYIVDREGVEETARYFDTSPVILAGCYHDVMLGVKWRQAADAILHWLQTIELLGPLAPN